MNEDIKLEDWSYMKMCMSSHDATGKIVLEKPKKGRKKRCPLGRKIVSSPFFRSIVYHVDYHIETAKTILENRKRDLDEFTHYVQDEQTDDDPNYRQELGREIIYWMKMVELYQEIKENKEHWCKKGKFPWSGIKVFTPYFDAPPVRMGATEVSNAPVDKDLTPVDAISNFVQVELTPVSKNGTDRKARRKSGNRKRNSQSKRSRV